MLCWPWQGRALVGCRTFGTYGKAECGVPLQVGARSINRVLIKAGAPLSESEAPRQKAAGYSGGKLTLFHLQWNKT